MTGSYLSSVVIVPYGIGSGRHLLAVDGERERHLHLLARRRGGLGDRRCQCHRCDCRTHHHCTHVELLHLVKHAGPGADPGLRSHKSPIAIPTGI